jgi:nucleoside-diphosphate-sugar epimerase
MRVLMTGGTGFVGYQMLAGKPHNCNVTYFGTDGYKEADWCKDQWDYIIHLAHVEPSKVIKAARCSGATLLYASSGAVYHNQPNQYGREKIDWEHKVLDSKIDCRIARIFTTCGARMKWDNFAIGQFIRDAVNGGPVIVKGSGCVIRSYMHGEDLSRWLWTILIGGDNGGVYDVGARRPVTIRELACEVAQNFYPERRVFIEGSMTHEQAPVYLPILDPPLGLHITIPFEEAVTKTVKSYLEEHA